MFEKLRQWIARSKQERLEQQEREEKKLRETFEDLLAQIKVTIANADATVGIIEAISSKYGGTPALVKMAHSSLHSYVASYQNLQLAKNEMLRATPQDRLLIRQHESRIQASVERLDNALPKMLDRKLLAPFKKR